MFILDYDSIMPVPIGNSVPEVCQPLAQKGPLLAFGENGREFETNVGLAFVFAPHGR